MVKQNKCCLCGGCAFYGDDNHCTLKKDFRKNAELQAENKRLLLAKIEKLERLLQKSIDLYFEFSNKDDFDKWVAEAKQTLSKP